MSSDVGRSSTWDWPTETLITSASDSESKGLLATNLLTFACVIKVVAFETASNGWTMSNGADFKPAVATTAGFFSWSPQCPPISPATFASAD